MNIDTNVIVLIIGYIVSIGVIYGTIKTKIEDLSQKVSKHNNLIERTYKIERDLSTAFVKIDENRHNIKRLDQEVRK